MEQVRKKIFCFVTGLVTGVLIGITVFYLFIGYRIDTYLNKIALLKNTIHDKDAKLEKLEESINTANLVLKDIEVVLIIEEEIGDDIDKLDIEKNIKEKYTSLLGKEVKNIDVEMVAEVIDKRIFKIENKEYQLYVKKIILTEILKIWIDVKELSSQL